MGAPAILEDPEKTEWTEEEYLNGVGLDPNVRYEYVRGQVYAMATPSGAHAEISSSLFVALYQHLAGKRCRVFKGEMAVRINFLGKPAFYIPDIMVACDDKPLTVNFREEPLILVEIMSPSTSSMDLREKLVAYTAIPSLRHYLVLSQTKVEAFHWHRTKEIWDDSSLTTLTSPEDVIHFPELDFYITVGRIYENAGLRTAVTGEV